MTWTPTDDVMSVPAQLFDSERVFLRDMASRVVGVFEDKPTIVNIGIWLGASCHCLRVGAPSAELVGIDVMGTYPIELAHPELLDYLRMRVIKRNSNFVNWEGPIHLLFVDGGHEYPVVVGDIINFCPYVVPGGYVVFHDSARPEVLPAINDKMRKDFANRWEELTDKDPMKRVGTLAWFRRLE